ncbi:hypothetical protein Acr_10g0006320 [Actinidia rufa]|uniref:Uncharacterized protein n=1 Tax=Actinidia rufa TaxID=165716 RepID=A0A7J0FBI6_9ERIC|nr:hypothetical protein Acr_10g0006320 [Actinidia rufa]
MTSLQYYYALTTLWQRLDHLADYTPICSADITAFRKFIDKQRVFKFLAGIRDEYDQVRCHILNTNLVPSLREAFAIIQNEENRRGVMLPPIPSERSALFLFHSPSVAASLPIVILVLMLVVMIKISYIVITFSDLVTLGRPAGVYMVDLLLEDEVVVQDLRVAVVAVLVLIILQWSNLLLQALSL